MSIVRSIEEIEEALNNAIDASNTGDTSYPEMSYEEGVRDTLLWVTEEDGEIPL